MQAGLTFPNSILAIQYFSFHHIFVSLASGVRQECATHRVRVVRIPGVPCNQPVGALPVLLKSTTCASIVLLLRYRGLTFDLNVS